MNKSIEVTRQAFTDLKKAHTFVVFEKQGAALRNSYGTTIPESIPDIAMGDTATWSDTQPSGVYVTEAYNPRRGEIQDVDVDRMIADGAEHINKLGKQAVVYSWFDSIYVQKLTERLDIAPILVGRDKDVCAHIEDKTMLQAHLLNAGCENVMTPAHSIVDSAKALPSYEDTSVVFGEKFVLQGTSMGGDGTVIVENRDSYDGARQKLKNRIRVSEFVDAPYSSVYCLSVPNQEGTDVATFVDGPSHKPIDISMLGIGNTAGAGGEWCSPHEQFDAEQLTGDISKLSSYFYKKFGYHGHFVVEGFTRDGRFLFNEINARPGGGSEVNSLYQIEQGLSSFTTAHILGRIGRLHAEQMPLPEEYNAYAQDRALNGRLAGAFYLKYKNPSGHRLVPTSSYEGSGVYQLQESGQLVKTSDALVSTKASISSGEALITKGPAVHEHASVARGKLVCSVEGRLDGMESLTDADNTLRPDVRRIVDALPSLFTPEQ